MKHLILLSFLPLLACAGGDQGSGDDDDAPATLQVEILAPADGAQLWPGVEVELLGAADDGATATWSDSVAGELASGELDEAGETAASAPFEVPGDHTLTLHVEGDAGAWGEASVALQVLTNTLPSVQITSPLTTDLLYSHIPVVFAVTVVDAEEDTAGLSVRWDDSTGATLAEGTLDTGGQHGFSASFDPGAHAVTAFVQDSGGLIGSGTVGFVVDEAPCSGFGMADPSSGVCACNPGYTSTTGEDCVPTAEACFGGPIEYDVDGDGVNETWLEPTPAECEMFELVNYTRATHDMEGTPECAEPLEHDILWSAHARNHSKQMYDAGYLFHEDYAYSQNCAMNWSGSPSGMMDQYMTGPSEPHCPDLSHHCNIMRCGVSRIGVGSWPEDTHTYNTQNIH